MEQEGSIHITREELYKKIWSKAMVQVAEEFGISDVALKKRCRKHAIPMPPRGYWRQIQTGRKPRRQRLPPCPAGVSETLTFSAPGSRLAPEAAIQEGPPLPRVVKLPGEAEDLHPIAARLKAQLAATDADEKGLKNVEARDLPRVNVSDGTAWKCCQCLHALISLLDERGITARELECRHPGIVFAKNKEYVRIEVEESVEAREKPRKSQTGRYPIYQPPEYTYHPTGFLSFHIEGSRWGMTGQKNWNESQNQSLEYIIPRIAQRIVKALPQLIAAGIEADRREREYQQRLQRRQHEEWIEKHQQAVLQNLGRAAYWWHRSQEIHSFLSALEKQWSTEQPKGLTEEQTSWLQWAREQADSLSPLADGYPNLEADGPVNYEAIPVGGPYPRVTGLSEIPEASWTATEFHPPADLRREYRYPFWLRYQK